MAVGFRPPSNWYNRMSDDDKRQHEFHENLLSEHDGSDNYRGDFVFIICIKIVLQSTFKTLF